jgi:hypothetical protein
MIQKTLAGGIFKDTIRVPHALYKSTVEYYSAELKLDCNLVGSYSPSNDINTSYGDIDILVKCDDDFDLGKKKDSVKSILNVDIKPNKGFNQLNLRVPLIEKLSAGRIKTHTDCCVQLDLIYVPKENIEVAKSAYLRKGNTNRLISNIVSITFPNDEVIHRDGNGERTNVYQYRYGFEPKGIFKGTKVIKRNNQLHTWCVKGEYIKKEYITDIRYTNKLLFGDESCTKYRGEDGVHRLYDDINLNRIKKVNFFITKFSMDLYFPFIVSVYHTDYTLSDIKRITEAYTEIIN